MDQRPSAQEEESVLVWLLRRCVQLLLTLFGASTLLFIVFFCVASADDVAQKALGARANSAMRERWKVEHGYAKPLWPQSVLHPDSLLYDHYSRSLRLDFGTSDVDRVAVGTRLAQAIPVTLSVTLPAFVLSVLLALPVALFSALWVNAAFDRVAGWLSIVLLCLPSLFLVLAGQYVLAEKWRYFPLSGYAAELWWQFIPLPIVIGVVVVIGAKVRFYRAVLLEEMAKPYVRAARARALSDVRILLVHVFPNAALPLVAQLAAELPLLFAGTLVVEAFLGLPGMGALTYEAIKNNDFAVLRASVFWCALLYVLAEFLAEYINRLLDPRLRNA